MQFQFFVPRVLYYKPQATKLLRNYNSANSPVKVRTVHDVCWHPDVPSKGLFNVLKKESCENVCLVYTADFECYQKKSGCGIIFAGSSFVSTDPDSTFVAMDIFSLEIFNIHLTGLNMVRARHIRDSVG